MPSKYGYLLCSEYNLNYATHWQLKAAPTHIVLHQHNYSFDINESLIMWGFLSFLHSSSLLISFQFRFAPCASPGAFLPWHPEQAVRWTKIISAGMLFSLKNSANLWTITSRLQHVIFTIFSLVHTNELVLRMNPNLLLYAYAKQNNNMV